MYVMHITINGSRTDVAINDFHRETRDVAVSGGRAFTPTNYNSRRRYALRTHGYVRETCVMFCWKDVCDDFCDDGHEKNTQGTTNRSERICRGWSERIKERHGG